MAMHATPVARRTPSAAATHMQAVLSSASLHPPPGASLDAVASSATLGGGGGASGVAPELMAVSEKLDLVVLCAGNTIRAVNLAEPSDGGSYSSSNNNNNGSSSNRRGTAAQEQQYQHDPFREVSFAADCAPRPGDDTIPSDSIPAKMPIKGLEFSPSGHSLLIWGESYVAVARLPRSASRGGLLGSAKPTPRDDGEATPVRGEGGRRGGDPGARWKWTLVDMSGYVVDVRRQRVVQAAWHPASDSCVTLLTVGREDGGGGAAGGGMGAGARAFVMLHVPGRERPEQVIQIPDGPGASPPVAIAHGRSAGWQRYAIWIARRDGSVAALCPVVPENAKIDSEELLDLWSVTADTLVAARWERHSGNAVHSQSALDEEIARLEQQQAWLRDTFGDVFDGQVTDHGGESAAATAAADRRSRISGGGEAGALGEGARCRHPVLQDDVVAGRGGVSGGRNPGGERLRGGGEDEARGEDAGVACGLVVLTGAEGSRESGETEVAAPPPVVLAVAYRAGYADIALVPAGVSPRWSHRSQARVSLKSAEVGGGGGVGAVLESLDLADRSSDKGARKRQGLSLSACTGAWTLLAATPRRVTSITVTWAGRIEQAAQRARERAAQGRPGESGRLDGDLRALLHERPDSTVNEVLFVASHATMGRIVGVVPIASPVIGNLAMARLAGGAVEMVNLAVVMMQATEVASAAKRARAQETPGRGDMLPPFEAALQKATDELEERRADTLLSGSPAGQLLMSEVDKTSVRVVEEEASKVVNGGIAVLEKLHLKTSTRLQTLSEIHEHQSGVIVRLTKDVKHLRRGREEVKETLDDICDVADDQRARSASVLAVMQATRPDISPAERAFISEMKEMENYADRQQVMMEPAAKQVEELRMAEKQAEDFLVAEAQGLGGVGGRDAGAGLSEGETRDLWIMLQADRERILSLSRRLEAARSRLGELGVRDEEEE